MSATHMREMTIPGFTAEASVYQVRRTYNLVAGNRSQLYAQKIVPQACFIDDGFACCCDPFFGCSCTRTRGLPE